MRPQEDRVPFLRPTFPPVEQIAADYAAILQSGIFTNGGRVDHLFRAGVEEWIGGGVRATTVASCTAGIELAIKATFRRGLPLAIVSSFTFVAGPLAAVNCGYKPYFVDVDPLSWQPDATDARRFLLDHGDQVGGILLAATFGVPDPHIAQWEQLAEDFGVPLVLDCAAGFGSEHSSGEPAGRRGTCEVFSLHATKVLAAGEGGVIASRDSALIDELDQMKNFGFDKDRRSTTGGTNAKLPELTAAIALRQLAALPTRLARRRQSVQAYIHSLAGLGLTFQPGVELSAPAFASAMLPAGGQRDAVISALDNAGLECRDYYNPPVHRQPFFAEAAEQRSLRVTDDLARRAIALPMSDDLDAGVGIRVAQIVEEVLHG